MSPLRKPLAVLLALAATAAILAQDAPTLDRRPVAFTNARILTMAGDPIERGTLVIRDGKIEALGADVTLPAGARVVDCDGHTIMPGMVNAWSRAGLGGGPSRGDERQGGRRGGGRNPMPVPMPGGGGGAQNKAATRIADGLYAKQSVFGELLQLGVTTLSLVPGGSGFAGLGALLRPDGKTTEQLVARDDAFLLVGMARDPQTKKILKEGFEKAQKLVEERKKPPEPPKTEAPVGDAKAEAPKAEAPKTEAPKPGPAPQPTPNPTPNPTPTPPPPTPQPTPTPTPKPDGGGPPPQGGQAPAAQPAKRPEQPKDPNLEILADLLEGKRRALVQIDSAADLLHWQHAIDAKVKFPRTVVVTRHDDRSGTVDTVVDQLKAWDCAVLLPPDLATLPRSRFLIHPARTLHDAGVEIGFLIGDTPAALRALNYRLIELVRAGLPADVALRGVTLVPAKALGIDKSKGSLATGKDADLLIFRGDPLSATGELKSVWLAGREVPQQP